MVASEFSKLMTTLDYPMVIVTATSTDGERSGCLVGFSTQASIHPPRYLVGISMKNHTHRVISRADAVAVHFPEKRHRDLVELFGSETGDDVDKFARCAWSEGRHGPPLLDDVERRFEASVVDRMPWGDHTGLLLDPFEVHAAEPTPADDAVTFQEVKAIDPGHDP